MTREDAMNLDCGITMSVQALITVFGMYSENQHKLSNGESIAYTEADFNKIIGELGIHHNAVLSRWYPK
ncbi:MAG TPA: hypothetical protein PK573_02265 [Spirochaetota bacterium]|nr:hypothetical protein [Spirochaetota bacterium]HRZ28709.1 hypothetical protein [Spirochaetota bacterium]